MITVGLDFGTHQTKICIEDKDGVELSYHFMQFRDSRNRLQYTLPSVIGVGSDGRLSYGYLPSGYKGRIIRYFKQCIFFDGLSPMSKMDAMYYSSWYLANILFDLEAEYGDSFSIQMGAPTDSSHVESVKAIATCVIATAYRLVENVYANDKQKFLDTPLEGLKEITELVPYSKEVKDEYQLRVFPEAYACLKPLISRGKLSYGMSLMIDIGGGTTDISFFTIERKDPHDLYCKEYVPQVYDFYSIDKGLNFLTNLKTHLSVGVHGKVNDESMVDSSRRTLYFNEINDICNTIRAKLQHEFKVKTRLSLFRLWDALRNRPLIYCGGGSTFRNLMVSYSGYQDRKQISAQDWNVKSVKDIDTIVKRELCPILSTAYGLSISTVDDNIIMKPFEDIFKDIQAKEEEGRQKSSGGLWSDFSYSDDWSAWK